MITANEHCQRGLANPYDEMPEPIEHTIDMSDGRHMTKSQFLKWLSSQLKWVSATEEVHEEGMLYIRIPFDFDEE